MVAILYEKNAFETSTANLVGAQIANHQFLNALVSDESFDELSCYTRAEKDFEEFRTLIESCRPAGKTVSRILHGDYSGLSRARLLHLPPPATAPHQWPR